MLESLKDTVQAAQAPKFSLKQAYKIAAGTIGVPLLMAVYAPFLLCIAATAIASPAIVYPSARDQLKGAFNDISTAFKIVSRDIQERIASRRQQAPKI